MTTAALKTIDKVGGIDEYLLRMRPEKIEDKKILSVREQILNARNAAEVP
jgi:ribosomal protein L28